MARFIIADDHELMRSALQELLQLRSGWEVCASVGDGWKAVEAAEQHHPDAAIVDLGLPGLGGLEVTRMIRAESPATGVVLYTGGDARLVMLSATEAGAADVVQKGEPSLRLLRALELLVAPGCATPSPKPSAAAVAAREAERLGLTSREVEILKFLAEGKSNWSTGTILGISERTVETHRSNIMKKLSLASVVELVHYAIQNGLVQP
jgi:DNA-binding NarL/FixJ family response regulator